MKRTHACQVLLAGVALVASLAAIASPARGEAAGTDAATLAAAQNAFAVDLYAQVREQKGNLFLSPYSISTALTMTYEGAAGATAQEMAKALRLPGHAELNDLKPWTSQRVSAASADLHKALNAGAGKRPFELHVANALWGKKGYPFKDAFLKLVKDDFDGGLTPVDFAQPAEAAKTINDWVARQTNDKIKDIVPADALNDLTRLVLTNAIYFKAPWMSQFTKEITRPAPFYPSADDEDPVLKVQADMMNQSLHTRFAKGDGLSILELPYKGGQTAMLILLPEKRDGLAELEKSLSAEKLQKWLAGLKGAQVDVSVPKFKTTCQFSLGQKLQAMGMKLAFDADRADFSNMAEQEKLFITAVLHKAFVDVNEEGTEAAAATAVMVGATAMPLQVEKFTADHPFLFLIQEKASGSILFMGRVVNPK